jgi:hypothetical protein
VHHARITVGSLAASLSVQHVLISTTRRVPLAGGYNSSKISLLPQTISGYVMIVMTSRISPVVVVMGYNMLITLNHALVATKRGVPLAG